MQTSLLHSDKLHTSEKHCSRVDSTGLGSHTRFLCSSNLQRPNPSSTPTTVKIWTSEGDSSRTEGNAKFESGRSVVGEAATCPQCNQKALRICQSFLLPPSLPVSNIMGWPCLFWKGGSFYFLAQVGVNFFKVCFWINVYFKGIDRKLLAHFVDGKDGRC